MQETEQKRGLEAWIALISFLWRYFSISELNQTFLNPWHRDTLGKEDREFELYEKIIFNVFSRTLGALSRLIIILLGIFTILLSILFLPFFLIFHLKINERSLDRHKAIGRSLAYGFTPFLKRHSRDLSKAREVALIGKIEALSQLERVLTRERQNNALLVGDPGSGRTTLAEQFAKRVSWGEVASSLQYREVFELVLEGLNESDMTRALHEAAAAGNVIVVIDNIHSYPGLPNILLPYLDISQMQIIGITNFQDFHGNLKNHADMMRFFEKIEIQEPAGDEITILLQAIAAQKQTDLDPEAAKEIVGLTNRLIHNVPQPEKSLDILDELLVARPKKIGVEDVDRLVSEKTATPVGKLSEHDRKQLLNLEEELKKEIIGQVKAVEAIAEALRRHGAGLEDPKRPVGSFLFLGPTGVGKTHTAKTLAKVYYDSQDNFVRFDMSEFRELSSLEVFIDRLVVSIEEDPFTLLLFDEVEKSHPDILNVFLQILDEGHVTDSSGRKGYFNNALIIATSNAGSELLIENPSIGKDQLLDQIIGTNIFRPEFINRFDEVVLFSPLSLEEARAIAGLMLEKLRSFIAEEKKIRINFDSQVVDALAKTAYDSRFGARAIRRTLQDTVEDYIARKILEDDLEPEDTLTIPPSLFI